MAFKLHITITGMCLFVPEPKRARVHVLLLAPDLCASSMPVEEQCSVAQSSARHYPRLFYAHKYEAGSKATDFRCISLDDKVLDLTAFGSKGNAGSIPGAVLDLTPSSGGVDQKFVGIDPPDVVAAHVILPLASSTDYCDSGTWQLGEWSGMVPFEVTWDVNATENALDWTLAGLRKTDGGLLLPSLTPQNDAAGVSTIELRIKNVMRGDLMPGNPQHPNAPVDGKPIPHFSAYYCVVGGEPQSLIYRRNMPQATKPRCATRGDFFTCMVAQASLA
jgi:hypothetical protein